MQHKLINTVDYLLIVDDSEIKEGDYYLFTWGGKQEIQRFKDQESDRQNHEYLYRTACKKIIAHLPLNNSPILEGVALLPPLEDKVEKLAKEQLQSIEKVVFITSTKEEEYLFCDGFEIGYNKAKEKYKYTEEDMIECWKYASIDKHQVFGDKIGDSYMSFIQSLQQPKIPVGFKCEVEDVKMLKNRAGGVTYFGKPKTTTNSKGLTQWVGEYIY